MKQRGLAFKPREEFLCKICGMSFTQKSSLKKHIATIHENKRYPCKDCDKIFTQSSGLHRHVRLFHKGEKEDIRKGSTCSKCNTYFKSELKLKQHISCAHPDSLGKNELRAVYFSNLAYTSHIKQNLPIFLYICTKNGLKKLILIEVPGCKTIAQRFRPMFKV